MLRRSIISLFCVSALVLTFSGNAVACACCAEPGTYSLRTFKPDTFTLDLVKQFEFDKNAKLYMTEAGFDTITGLDPLVKEYEADPRLTVDGFDLIGSFTGKVWRFDFKSPNGASGSLTFSIPGQMVQFKVDIHDQQDPPLGPILYKELRFKGSVSSARGFTRSGFVRGTTYFLVFQGRGVGCDEVSDFKNWRLEIDGPKAGYAFFGKLVSAAN